VVPARYDEPVQTAPREPFPAQLMPRGAPDARFSGAPNTTTGTTPPRAAETTVDPAVQAAQQAAARAAADLLAGSLTGTGNPGGLSLSDVLARCAESERSAAVQAYWRLSRATSNYNWAVDEQQRLDQVVSNRGAVDGPMLSTVRAAAAARVTEAELEKTFATAALGRAIPSLNVSGLTPTDRPLVGPYHTYYNQIFGNRSVGRTWEIDRTLPIRLKAINDRAAAVQSAVSAVHYGEQAHAAGELDLRTVLACHEALHTQRREFLDCALQYNLDIGEYALAAAPAGTPPEKLAGMMIPVKQPERLSAVPGKLAAPSSAVGSERSPRSDGWVPSTLRSLEPEAMPMARSMENSSRADTPVQKQVDPFGAPASDRYGDRYGSGNR
jgi:hypothetical protein